MIVGASKGVFGGNFGGSYEKGLVAKLYNVTFLGFVGIVKVVVVAHMVVA